MTTPNQSLPDPIEGLLGIGAYEIGGGRDGKRFGQDINEEYVRDLVTVPFPTFGNMFQVVRQILLKMPIEVLDGFRPFVPDWLEGDGLGVVEAVEKIIASLADRDPIAKLSDLIERFLSRGDLIPISHLEYDFFPNILVRNNFATSEDIFAPNLWHETVGFNGPGSLKMVADGTRQVWESPEDIKVRPGRELTLSAMVAGYNLISAGGEPVALGVSTYLDGVLVGEEIVDTVFPPAAAPTTPTVGTLPFTLPITLSSGTTPGAILPFTLPIRLTALDTVPDLEWVELSGSYTAPEGVDSVHLQISMADTALAGDVYADYLSMRRLGLIERFWVNGLAERLLHIREDGFFDGEKLFGRVTTEVEEVHETWDRFWANVYGDDTAEDVGFQGFINAVRSLSISTSNSAEQARTAIGMFNFGASQSIWGAANPTFETTIPLGSLRKPAVSGDVVTTSNDPWSTTATQASSAMGFVRCKQSQDKTVVQWLGKGRLLINTCKLHIYRMNTITGDLTWLQTENIVAAGLPLTDFAFVNVPLTTPVHVEQGDVLALEVCVTGAGTHTIAGVDTPWLPDDLTARPKRIGAGRNSGTEASAPATILDASVGYNAEVPYIGAGVLLSELPTPKYTYSETFDGNTGQWTAVGGGLLFENGVFKTATGGQNVARFNQVTYTDESRVEFDFRADWNALFGGFGDNDHIRLIGWADETLSQYVAVDIESHLALLSPISPHTLRIVTGTSPTTVTTRASGVEFGRNYSGRIGIEYDPQTNTYGVFMGSDPTPVLTWTDNTNIITHGPGHRFTGIYADLSGEDFIVCDNFSYRDV